MIINIRRGDGTNPLIIIEEIKNTIMVRYIIKVEMIPYPIIHILISLILNNS
jgi:hypothetical protein